MKDAAPEGINIVERLPVGLSKAKRRNLSFDGLTDALKDAVDPIRDFLGFFL